jgi:hypothetical protein
MDKFIYFATVPKDIQELLARHESPDPDWSIWKSIPIEHLDRVRKAIKSSGRFRVVYRGPRLSRLHGSTNKKDAVAFAVYDYTGYKR